MRISDWSSDVCSSDLSLIVGGQIKGAEPRLFLIYPEGNFIEAGEDNPFFQIGETKYGRPIIVRSYDPAMPFEDSVKLLCVSFDSTIARKSVVEGKRVSVSVGPGGRRLIKKKKT